MEELSETQRQCIMALGLPNARLVQRKSLWGRKDPIDVYQIMQFDFLRRRCLKATFEWLLAGELIALVEEEPRHKVYRATSRCLELANKFLLEEKTRTVTPKNHGDFKRR